RRHTSSYGDWSSDVCSSDLRTTDGMKYSFINHSRADVAARINALPASVQAADHEVRTGEQAFASATQSLGLPHFGSNAWAVAPRSEERRVGKERGRRGAAQY